MNKSQATQIKPAINIENTDIIIILEKIIREQQENIKKNKILLNTSFCHDTFQKATMSSSLIKKVCKNLLSFIIQSMSENSRIVIETYIEENNYHISINITKIIKQKLLTFISQLKELKNITQQHDGDLNITNTEKECCFIDFFFPVSSDS